MPDTLSLSTFLERSGIILDVRSPLEYHQGHLPNSFSLPLFTDDERSFIGKTYKKDGQEVAIDLGLKLVGPKLSDLVQLAKFYLGKQEGKILCWRGGMRSGFVARLLESVGLATMTLQGGYRSFRRWVIKSLTEPSYIQPRLFVIGGLTGSGKTAILHQLKEIGEQVIDLELMASHRGSVFGHIGLASQPTQEQFENELAYCLQKLDFSRPIWIEDESRLVGKCYIPTLLYQSMSMAPIFYIERSLEERIEHLCHLYGHASQEELIEATQRISKRLGGRLTHDIIYLLENNQKREAFKHLLFYYDKAYQYQLTKKQAIHFIKGSDLSDQAWAYELKNQRQWIDKR